MMNLEQPRISLRKLNTDHMDGTDPHRLIDEIMKLLPQQRITHLHTEGGTET